MPDHVVNSNRYRRAVRWASPLSNRSFPFHHLRQGGYVSGLNCKLRVAAIFALVALINVHAHADEPMVVVVKVFPSAGREDELQAQYLKRIEFLRKSEPNATFRLHRSTKSPVTFLWYEVYPS